jgi:Tfp pilus assembly protein PilN
VITKLNLSSSPFRNRTTPYLISILLIGLAGMATIFLLAKLRENSELNKITVAQIQQMEAEVARLKGEGEKVQQQLSPQQRELLVASHKLVANKSFGWSRLFFDLESVLPGSVSASRISVENVYKDGDKVKAELDFGVLSRDYAAVMSMIDQMNNSGIFQAELRGQDRQKTERITYTEYTLRLTYTQNYTYSTAPATDIAQAQPSEGGVQP